ncbi:MAG: T9SS type A sorting domain-containing protein [Bacteroidetes bacterium]|nr:T9SS type A sorting domain-containing protein [Bacteroidota bacterium]
MRRSLFLLMLLNVWYHKAQFSFNFSDSIQVTKNGSPLSLAWSGGLNYAQFSEIDYDYDDDMDLLVFDRSNDQIRLFENRLIDGNRSYVFNPIGQTLFPSDLRYRLTAIDYNQDGENDLFAYGIGGIKVYKNTGNSTTGLQWTVAKNLLYSDNWGTQLNLYVSSADIPAIVDVDLDGDIDILTYHISGEYLQYHKNISQETYGNSDSLVFELKNECWGGFREDVNSNTVFLNDQTAPCQGGNVPNPQLKPNNSEKAHAGSTVLAIDMNGNGVKDLILGDVAYPSLNFLTNGGTEVNTNSLMISANPNFPSNSTPVSMQLFPAAFWVDVDFDLQKDLLVAPNAKNVSENESSVLKYKNTAANNTPNFVFDTKAFLQEDMIEHGTGSIPVLTDIDNDGLVDLLVANYFTYKPVLAKESKIAYYKNTGTADNPVFTFIDNDFLNLSQEGFGLRMVPSFGDLNNDGKKDIILGLENGTLCYLQNTSTGSVPTFSAPVVNYPDHLGQSISVGQFAAPQLFDLNDDGKLDLLIGKKTGEVLYYLNIGTISNPSFELMNSNLGNVDVSTPNSPDGFAFPHFFRHLDTTYLMVGSLEGSIYFYDSIDDNLTIGSNFRTISANFLNQEKNIGGYSSCAVGDLDNDLNLDLFLGQDLGGLFYLENDNTSTIGIQENNETEIPLQVFPNPTDGIFNVQTTNFPLELVLFSAEGRFIRNLSVTQYSTVFDFSSLTQGIYFIKVKNKGNTYKIFKF